MSGPQPPQPIRDAKIDLAKAKLLNDFFGRQPDEVFYGRQLEVLMEREFFHWITVRALGELVAERKVCSQKVRLNESIEIGFFWSRTNRYWKRKAETYRRLVLEYSDPNLGLGLHAELMHTVALAKARFLPVAEKVRSYRGRVWEETRHDLDLVVERDEVAYGVEIKNTLSYIDKRELEVKLEMCAFLGLRPLFIVRMAPKSYVELVRLRGGFTLIIAWQLYPFGHHHLVARIRESLHLPVDCPRAIQEGTTGRLVRWHEAQPGAPPR
jgi:hypothetical protein